MPDRPLTPRQREVLDTIDAMTEPRGPTFREMADRVGISPRAIQYHIMLLEEAGFVERLGGYRGIVLTEAGRAALMLAEMPSDEPGEEAQT